MSWNAKKYARFQAAVERSLEGIKHVSTGACPGCSECNLSDDATDSEIASSNDGGFSWSSCDCCGSSLGGSRYPAHGDVDGKLIHLDVCADCLEYIEYGRLNDDAMMEIEERRKSFPLTVLLECAPDLDPETGNGGHSCRREMPAESLKHAASLCREFIDEWQIGASQWLGGDVKDETGKAVARISYNGRCWEPGPYPQKEIVL